MSTEERRRRRRREEEDGVQGRACTQGNSDEERRLLRAKYRELRHTIHDQKEELARLDPRKFMEMVSEVNDLHNNVRQPREQIADAEAVLDITKNFVDCVKDSKRRIGISSATFVGHIMSTFSLSRAGHDDNAPAAIDWAKLGLSCCGMFKVAPGLSTMLGPMDTEPKIRRAPGVRRPHVRPTQATQAEEVTDRSEEEANAQTDANMETMFKILRVVKQARLDALVLNRGSFSQTVENIFSLSFLVKDGRVAITFNEDGEHVVAPKNAPTAEARASRQASNTQFVFRLDWKCWQTMRENLPQGLELMPDRAIGSETESPGLIKVDGSSNKRARNMDMKGRTSQLRV